MAKFFASVITAVTSIIMLMVFALACQFLPYSPFQKYLSGGVIANYLQYINFFLPIKESVVILETWVLAVLQIFIWSACYKAIMHVSSAGTDLIPLP